MLISNSDDTLDPSNGSPIVGGGTTSKTVTLLDELLAHSVRLRDLYKNARWQTSDIRLQHLRLLFDEHYKEQLRLVDVLIDRIRLLGGAGRVLAGVFLQGTQFSYALRGRTSPILLLRTLLDAHESALSAAGSTAKSGAQDDGPPPNHDFVVGQVVLSNDLQSRSVSEQLLRLKG
jgi:starvation-inducible DNA-binding protein